MASIETVIDGHPFRVDLDRVTAWDAIAYRAFFGSQLEDLVAYLCTERVRVTAVEHAVVVWLWLRQNGSPDTTIRQAAELVPLLVATPADLAAIDPTGPAAPAADSAPAVDVPDPVAAVDPAEVERIRVEEAHRRIQAAQEARKQAHAAGGEAAGS